MILHEIIEAQFQRLNVFADPESSMFWPFLVVVVPFTVYAWRRDVRKSGTWMDYLRYLFPRSFIRSLSFRQDVMFFIFIPMIMAGIGYAILLSLAPVPGYVSALLTGIVGHRQASLVTIGDRMAITVLSYLAIDFGFYAAHYLQHRIPILWKFHRVHHSATVLTPFTELRGHPVVLALSIFITTLFSSIVIGVFLYFNGNDISEINYLGVNIVNLGLFAFLTVLRHSHVWINFGPLSYFIMSPAMHQLHHSCEERHWGKNFASSLTIWDWMFGTIYVPKSRERFRVGLPDKEGKKMTRRGFVDLMFDP